jgi:hypothetical protein
VLSYLNNKKTSSTSEEYRVSFDHVLFTAGGVIFADGFEAGDTSAWSATVPWGSRFERARAHLGAFLVLQQRPLHEWAGAVVC